MDTQIAIDTIVSFETLPPQIDYVSPRDKAEFAAAQELISNLPTRERLEAEVEVQKRINQYYDSLF